MSRTTRADLDSAFAYFVRSIGGTVAESWPPPQPDSYWLAHESNGYVVYQYVPNSSGVTEPFGARRRSAGEMYRTLVFAADAAHIATRNQ